MNNIRRLPDFGARRRLRSDPWGTVDRPPTRSATCHPSLAERLPAILTQHVLTDDDGANSNNQIRSIRLHHYPLTITGSGLFCHPDAATGIGRQTLPHQAFEGGGMNKYARIPMEN